MNYIAVLIAKNLDLNVTGLTDIFLKINIIIRKVLFGLGSGSRKILLHLLNRVYNSHSSTTAAGSPANCMQTAILKRSHSGLAPSSARSSAG